MSKSKIVEQALAAARELRLTAIHLLVKFPLFNKLSIFVRPLAIREDSSLWVVRDPTNPPVVKGYVKIDTTKTTQDLEINTADVSNIYNPTHEDDNLVLRSLRLRGILGSHTIYSSNQDGDGDISALLENPTHSLHGHVVRRSNVITTFFSSKAVNSRVVRSTYIKASAETTGCIDISVYNELDKLLQRITLPDPPQTKWTSRVAASQASGVGKS